MEIDDVKERRRHKFKEKISPIRSIDPPQSSEARNRRQRREMRRSRDDDRDRRVGAGEAVDGGGERRERKRRAKVEEGEEDRTDKFKSERAGHAPYPPEGLPALGQDQDQGNP